MPVSPLQGGARSSDPGGIADGDRERAALGTGGRGAAGRGGCWGRMQAAAGGVSQCLRADGLSFIRGCNPPAPVIKNSALQGKRCAGKCNQVWRGLTIC